MKQLIFFLFFLPLTLEAQTDLWPTNNAEWYYSFTDQAWINGYSHIKIERDTVILGKSCQVYSRNLTYFFYGLLGADSLITGFEEDFAIICLEDSVLLLYANQVAIFDTIIDFKAQVGDSWRAYVRTQQDICLNPNEFILTTVLAKELVNVNGRDLLKFSIKHTPPSGSEWFPEDFYQQIGGNFNFVFNRFCNASDFSAEYGLRCFNYQAETSNEFIYKPYPGICDYLPSSGLIENLKTEKIIVSPNPVNSNENLKIKTQGNYTIVDIQGKAIQKGTIENNSVQLINVESGIYFFILDNENAVYKTKFVVR